MLAAEDKKRRDYLTIRKICWRLGIPEAYYTTRRKIIAAFEAGVFGEWIINIATGRNYRLRVHEDHYMEVIQWKGGRP
jgi:hypothetical protein